MNTGVETARIFLALWPDTLSRAGLARCRDAWRWNDGAKVVPTGQLHLTLHFIGSFPSDRLPQLAQSLQVAFDPFDLALERHELWPRGIAVLRPGEVPAGLRSLHAALYDVLRAQGLPVEAREYRPHVTLARRAEGSVPPVQAPGLRWRIAACVLVESVPGAGYRVLRDYTAS
ncbi:MAG: RNA 2',3'-cyclic phosphodiesterase [Burkholderiaceae bacterium]